MILGGNINGNQGKKECEEAQAEERKEEIREQ